MAATQYLLNIEWMNKWHFDDECENFQHSYGFFKNEAAMNNNPDYCHETGGQGISSPVPLSLLLQLICTTDLPE